MKNRLLCVVVVATAFVGGLRADVSKFDSRIARDTTQAAKEGLVWFDAKTLPMESKGYPETSEPYSRLPTDLLDKVPLAVKQMSRHATGHYLLFRTDSDTLGVEWILEEKKRRDPFIPPQGQYGVDVYVEGVDGWRFVKNGRLSPEDNPVNVTSMNLPGHGLRGVLVYLPTRGIVKSLRLGLKPEAKRAAYVHRSGFTKPVVHYGTSIVHGGCVSRPGLCFTAIAARLLDVPYVNHGYSGSARLEPEMAVAIARTDASLYIVDPVWNCSPEIVNERLEKFLRTLHELRPSTPILVCEGIEPTGRRHQTNAALKTVYDRLLTEKSSFTAQLHYLPFEGLIPTDGESTHDYCHPNDYGSVPMGKAYAAAIRPLLK